MHVRGGIGSAFHSNASIVPVCVSLWTAAFARAQATKCCERKGCAQRGGDASHSVLCGAIGSAALMGADRATTCRCRHRRRRLPRRTVRGGAGVGGGSGVGVGGPGVGGVRVRVRVGGEGDCKCSGGCEGGCGCGCVDSGGGAGIVATTH
eukprot:6190992-Pleurochrysis_carterae.AAC.1